ncbi:MAG TPA: hypothetical protein VHE37_16935 [Nevskiaceae bacterium]|nr:hypothetical protein [Nevskiaceae bacterium]
MSAQPQIPVIAPVPSERRSPRAQTPRRTRARAHTRRRRSVALEQPLLQRWWNEHAVKSGMVVFYAWLAVANYGRVQHLLAQVFS